MPGPGGHHGGPGGPGGHRGPGGPGFGGPRPPMGGGMWGPPPRNSGCCGCLFPVIGVIAGVAAMLFWML